MNDTINTVTPERGLNAAGEYLFLPYDAKAPVTEKNKRTAKLTYKAGKKDGKVIPPKKPNACVLVSPILPGQIRDNIEALIPHVITLCESAQDAILRDVYESGKELALPDAISMESVIERMTADATGNRMTKDSINDWFDAEMKDTLAVLIADKMNVGDAPTDKQMTDLNRVVAVYRGKFAALASGATTYQEVDANRLIDALDKTETDSTMYGTRLRTRLEGMLAKDEELLLSL